MHPHYLVPVFSALWFSGIFFSLLFYAFLLYCGFVAKKKGIESQFRYFMAAIFIIREIYLYAYIFQEGQFTLEDSLPLHLCNISYLLTIAFLLRPNYFLFEFLIMLSLATALHSLWTPELTHGYSNYYFIDYYFSHVGIIFGSIYGLLILKMIPRTGSWLRVFVYGNVILTCVFILNLFFNSNYIYLMKAPEADNLFVLRPYPLHLIGFEIFGFLHIGLIYWLIKEYYYKNPTT